MSKKIDDDTTKLIEALTEFVFQAEHKKICCGSYGHLEGAVKLAKPILRKFGEKT